LGIAATAHSTGQMQFLSPNQQHQAVKENTVSTNVKIRNLTAGKYVLLSTAINFSITLLYSDYEIPLQYKSAELCCLPTSEHLLVMCFLNQADEHQFCRQDQKNHGYAAENEPCKTTFH